MAICLLEADQHVACMPNIKGQLHQAPAESLEHFLPSYPAFLDIRRSIDSILRTTISAHCVKMLSEAGRTGLGTHVVSLPRCELMRAPSVCLTIKDPRI